MEPEELTLSQNGELRFDDTKNIPASVSWILPDMIKQVRSKAALPKLVRIDADSLMNQKLLIVLLVGTLGGALTTRAESESSATATLNAAESYPKHRASCHGRDGRSKTAKGKRNHARNLAILNGKPG